MKIVFTGGGTGGHFYPIIAIAEAVRDVVNEQKIIPPTLYYLADKPYDEESLFANDIIFLQAPAGKVRRYTSLANITDIFVTMAGIIKCFFILLKVYPDVIVSKGGYASVPTVIAASLLRIPVIIHESDAKPGRANLLAAKTAVRIAIAFDAAKEGFPTKYQGKVAKTGIPIRKRLMQIVPKDEAKQALGLDLAAPTVFVMGGSTGSTRINETLLDALPDLVSFANVIHQTGKANFESIGKTGNVIIGKSEHKDRYHPHPYLNADSMALAAGAADVIVARAGSGSITEIALWGKPAILVPIPEAVSHDQRTNAYAYAHTGAAVVLEEGNLTPHVLASEVRRIGTDPAVAARMGALAAGFANPKAGRIIAEEALRIAISHEK